MSTAAEVHYAAHKCNTDPNAGKTHKDSQNICMSSRASNYKCLLVNSELFYLAKEVLRTNIDVFSSKKIFILFTKPTTDMNMLLSNTNVDKKMKQTSSRLNHR